MAFIAQPGHVCHFQTTCRLTIMRVDAKAGWIDFLYQPDSACELAEQTNGTLLSIEGPFGNILRTEEAHTQRALLIGEKLGLAPLVFFSQRLLAQFNTRPELFLLGDNGPFPFTPKPSQFILPGIPAGAIACIPLMEDWEIPSRLANEQSIPGCYEGSVVELAAKWLESQVNTVPDLIIYAYGSMTLVADVKGLAERFSLPYQAQNFP